MRSLLSSDCFGSSFWKSGTSVWMYMYSWTCMETSNKANWHINYFRIIFSDGHTLFLYPSDSCTLVDGSFEETAESYILGQFKFTDSTKCEGDLLGWTSRICLSKIVLHSPLLLKDIFAGYRIKKWQFFLPAYLNSSFYYLLASTVLINELSM